MPDAPIHTPDSAGLAALVDSMANVRVLVVGDLMLDRYVFGNVTRLSPEAPVPILARTHGRDGLGGAGNVVLNLRALGVAVDVIGVAGDDDDSGVMRVLLRDAGVDDGGVLPLSDRPTIVKTRYMQGPRHLLRVDAERIAPVPDDAARAVIDRALRMLNGVQAVILSDYGKGVLTPPVLRAVIDAAGAANIPVLVDPKGADYTLYRGAYAVTPNRAELALATGGMNGSGDSDIVAACNLLIAQSGIGNVIATRSEDGMSLVGTAMPGGPVHLRTRARAVFDVSGAGDTVIATLAAALAAGADLGAAAILANAAAGLSVEKIGAASVPADDLKRILLNPDLALPPAPDDVTPPPPLPVQPQNEADFIAPVFDDWDAAAVLADRWRAQGLRIGFTNGAFDILHPGHVTYLAQARSRCDRLVVALNCDESIRRYKSKDRPINDEESRARVLAALSSVDMVVIFGRTDAEHDRAELIVRRINPDVLVKGADYAGKLVDGADYVQSRGGVVWLAPVVEGKSTTAIIRKMAGEA